MTGANPFLGQTLGGRFQLRDYISAGAFSVVFEAVDVATGKQVALKLLSPAKAADLDAVAEFEVEGQLLQKLRSCKNVIDYIGTWTSPLQVQLGGLPLAFAARYHVLELADGSLAELLPDRDSVRWVTKLQLFRDALKGTHQMHRHRTMHRDIKCDNALLVLARRKGHIVKLGDLGRSRALDMPPRLAPAGYVRGRGDLRFAPPEYLWGLGADGEDGLRRADLYLLGSLLYELGTGQGFTTVAFPDEWIVARAYRGPSPREGFNQRLPELRAHLAPAVDLFARQVPQAVRQPAVSLVTQLCDPDPTARELRVRSELRQPTVGLDWLFRRVDVLIRLVRRDARIAAASRGSAT
jgi:serine/threonine-protein kinase